MSFRAAMGVGLLATLLLTESCGGGSTPPRAAHGPGPIDLTKHSASSTADVIEPGRDGATPERETPLRFEDLPVRRLSKAQVPLPSAASPSLGAASARVVVQMWSDFECPFCARTQPVLSELLRVYAGKVRLVWHDYPLPFHAHARLAANAGREAYAEGGASAFWKFHDAVYDAADSELDATSLTHFAALAGLDAARFRQSLSSPRHDSEIDRDVSLGDSLGVEGTPAFLVNDYFFVGAVPIEVLRVIVDRALSDAHARALFSGACRDCRDGVGELCVSAQTRVTVFSVPMAAACSGAVHL